MCSEFFMQNISFSNPKPTYPLLFFETRYCLFLFFIADYPPLIIPPGTAENLEAYRVALLLNMLNAQLFLLKTLALTAAPPWVKVIHAEIELNFDLDSCTSQEQGHLFNLQFLLLFETLALTAAPPRVKVTFAHIIDWYKVWTIIVFDYLIEKYTYMYISVVPSIANK